MSNTATVLGVLLAQAPRGETLSLTALRKQCGLPAHLVSAALQSLRYAGKIEWDRIALRPSLWVRDDAPVAVPVKPAPIAEARSGSKEITRSASKIKKIDAEAAPEEITPAAPSGDLDALWFLFPESWPDRPVSLSRVQAEILLEEIDDFCARTGTDRGGFGQIVLDFPGFVGLLRRRLTVRSDKAAAVRAAMAWAPDGLDRAKFEAARRDVLAAQAEQQRQASLAAAPGNDVPGNAVPLSPLAAQIEQEVQQSGKQRQLARSISTVARASRIDVAHARGFDGTDLQTMAIDSPADVVQALQRRWGDLWPRIVAQARSQGVRPVPHLVALLERALDEAGGHDAGEIAA